MIRKVCVVTGTRAEYGLLKGLMGRIKKDPDMTVQIIATCMHLSPEFGLTYQEIERGGFVIDKKVEILLSSDTPTGICKSMGLAMIGFGEAFLELKPDLLVLLGDRFETFCAAAAAAVSRIPIAHIHGGELTQGAMDDAFRHAITKMSHLHFTSAEEYKKRVIQLGENPEHVFNVGALGVENIRKLRLLTRPELEKDIAFTLNAPCILVTFHPVTLEKNTAREQFQELLDALDELPGLQIIFTKANADTDGRVINALIDEYVAKNEANAFAFISMGQVRYLSSMQYVDAVVGNSSSGIIEAPCFTVPTVNIGDRQKGRVCSASIINCEPARESVLKALQKALSPNFKNSLRGMVHPYEKENSAESIMDIIRKWDLSKTIKKEFFDLQCL
jgi:GDP/UDP-N,N'-diacetylbacillosamine 2-epimerase (hydrolysing)